MPAFSRLLVQLLLLLLLAVVLLLFLLLSPGTQRHFYILPGPLLFEHSVVFLYCLSLLSPAVRVLHPAAYPGLRGHPRGVGGRTRRLCDRVAGLQVFIGHQSRARAACWMTYS